jgi:hypothetical protein
MHENPWKKEKGGRKVEEPSRLPNSQLEFEKMLSKFTEFSSSSSRD